MINILLEMNILFETIKFLEKRKSIINFRIAIYCLYLTSWVYILYISWHTFRITDIEIFFLEHFQDNFDPFTQHILNYNYITFNA